MDLFIYKNLQIKHAWAVICCANFVNVGQFIALHWNKHFFFLDFSCPWQRLAWLQRDLNIEKLKSLLLCKKFVSLSDILCFCHWKHDSVSMKM